MREKLISEHCFAKRKCCLLVMHHHSPPLCWICRLELILCCLARVSKLSVWVPVLRSLHNLRLYPVVSHADWRVVAWKLLQRTKSLIHFFLIWCSQIRKHGKHWMLCWRVWMNSRQRKTFLEIRSLGHRFTKWCLFWLHITVGVWVFPTSVENFYTPPSRILCLMCHQKSIRVKFLKVSVQCCSLTGKTAVFQFCDGQPRAWQDSSLPKMS